MKPWAGPDDVVGKLQRRWQRGDFLEAGAQAALFPLSLAIRGPNSSEMLELFEAARDWVRAWQALEAKYPVTLAWREVHHRSLGQQRIPERLHVADVDALAGLLGREADLAALSEILAECLGPLVAVEDWVLEKPMRALARAGSWSQIMAVLDWMLAHPKSGLYVRQVEVHGVDSKFIEAHRGVIASIVERVFPELIVDAEAKGAKGFERRFGFKAKPMTLRFRMLDSRWRVGGLTDLAIPQQDFAVLNPKGIRRVFVTENEINGLAFPDVLDAMVIFGLGYGVDVLSNARWLEACEIFYWGDIDTHGFAILNRLRGYWPQTQSLLMDEEVFLAHRHAWVEEPKAIGHGLDNLDDDEAALYGALLSGRFGKRLRLEQERVGMSWLMRRMSESAKS